MTTIDVKAAVRYNRNEAHLGRLTPAHLASLGWTDDGEDSWRRFVASVGLFQTHWKMTVDGLAGRKTRMGLDACAIDRVLPVAPWHGRDAIVSCPFGDSRPDGPHRGADWMVALKPGEDAEGHVVYTNHGRSLFFPTWSRAVAAGVVKSIARIANGCWVKIDHGYGMITQYGHLNDIDVMPRDEVAMGQRLGGPAGRHATWPPHLHQGLQASWAGGVVRGYQDPVLWVPK